MAGMGKTDKDEVREVTLRVRQGELDDLKSSLGMLRMLGGFYPEGDPVQMSAVRVLEAAGMLKVSYEPAKKPGKAKPGRKRQPRA